MKNLVFLIFCLFLIQYHSPIEAQNNSDGSLGLPGDNLNLYAVMNLFQESGTLEVFEKNLNDENSRINNLDLNGDGNIDYINVIDNFDGKTHMIILRDAISANESQDIAVFYVGRDLSNRVQVQLIGDEALYGKDFIIEPNISGGSIASQTRNPGYSGNREMVVGRSATMGTSAWPLLSLLFLPSYVVWHSPYSYGYYPSYWRPWQPLFWHSYSGYHSNMDHYYKGNFRRSYQYRDSHFREHYYSGRHNFAPTIIQHKKDGYYNRTYSHPELRSEGSDRYNRLHQGNNNHTGNRPDPQSRKDIGSHGVIGNRSSENRNSLPSNRQGSFEPKQRSEQSHSRISDARPANNHNNTGSADVRPSTYQNNQRPAPGRLSGNQNNATRQESRPPINQNNARRQESRPQVNQNNARRQESRPQVNQNNNRSKSTVNTEATRPSSNKIFTQQPSGQSRSTSVTKPATNQPVRPNKGLPRNDNLPK